VQQFTHHRACSSSLPDTHLTMRMTVAARMQAVPIVMHGKAYHLDQSLTDTASNVCIQLSQQADVCRMLLNNANHKTVISRLIKSFPDKKPSKFLGVSTSETTGSTYNLHCFISM